ncbi:TPA: hypothetical protein ACS62H_004675 [Klebsiella pneumoniae]
MTYTKEQLIEQAKTRMEANRYLLTRLPPESATVKEVAMNLAIDEIALAALTAEPAKCGHVDMDCDDGKAVCLSCGKVWEV